ncbi:putative motility protein [Bradyrhizobium sp. CB1650]|uniref:putative motility protein n=1 Tax=Bradyrhizobium sp. CB1650 TaxID=3039153 RepID=UPI0024347E32|nr:putative motility protein [Bradyrhizobium sp. CB1650]WGD53654.1 putative motility protein [Bradyrhizobium sp. CB1650]
MDMMAMVSTMLAAQQGAFQSQVSATVMKQNMDAEKSAVLTLLGAGQPSLANVGAGVGGNLNIMA